MLRDFWRDRDATSACTGPVRLRRRQLRPAPRRDARRAADLLAVLPDSLAKLEARKAIEPRDRGEAGGDSTSSCPRRRDDSGGADRSALVRQSRGDLLVVITHGREGGAVSGDQLLIVSCVQHILRRQPRPT